MPGRRPLGGFGPYCGVWAVHRGHWGGARGGGGGRGRTRHGATEEKGMEEGKVKEEMEVAMEVAMVEKRMVGAKVSSSVAALSIKCSCLVRW